MKLRNLFFAALSVFALAACTETPESPYNPGGDNENGGTTANGFAYIDETFESSLGAFTTQQEVGNFAWKHEVYNEKAYAKVSGFANGASQNAISWLISPSFNLSNETKAYVSFEYVINKGEASAAATNHKLMVTSEYTGDATTTQWTEVDYEAVNNGSWNFQKTGNVSLPIDFIGAENVVIAFKYISTTETSSTWEVKNILVTGEVGATEEYNPAINKPSIISEAFTNGFGSFTTQETIGDFAWVSDAQYGAKASGFKDNASQDAESWLISPAIDFSQETAAYIAFDYVINKGDATLAAANHKLLITSNYTGDVATTEWSEVNYGAVNNNSWTFQNTGNIALPESIMGQAAVVIAFKYMSTTANSSTWEIKNVVVASGIGTTPETPETPVEPETPALASFDLTNPEALTPSVERATVAEGSTQGVGVDVDGYTFTNGNVSIALDKGSNTQNLPRFWTKTGGDVELRTYNGSTITISVSEGTMSSIVFKGGKVSTMSADCGSFSTGTWNGEAQSVTFSVTGTLNITSLEVY